MTAHLHHAIETWAHTRSAAHATALNAVIADICTELDMLRAQLDDVPEGCTPADAAVLRGANHALALELDAARAALSDLCTAYRALGGLDHAWDEPLMRAERALTGQPLSAAAEIGGAA